MATIRIIQHYSKKYNQCNETETEYISIRKKILLLFADDRSVLLENLGQ